MTRWLRLNRILTPRRMAYPIIAGGLLWLAWLISSIAGPGSMDLAGQVVGTDYLQFYSAGLTLRQGQSANLYNFGYQSQLEQSIAGSGLTSFHAFITPPFFAWLFVPLSYFPYLWSFILWSLLGILFLWLSIRLLRDEKPIKGFLWSLTWFPIFAAISFGQNSLLSLFLMSLTFWLMKKEKYLAAGLVGSLLLFKPQLVLGIGLLWLLENRYYWKSLIGLLLGGSILAGLSFWLLPEASRAYIDLSRNFLPQLIYQEQFPLWHLHSLRGFWILLFPGQELLAEGLSLILSFVGIVGYIYFWRTRRHQLDLLFAGAIILTIWISPHAMIYDWSILIVPAFLLWYILPDMRELWRPIFALVWLATFISGPLTFSMLKSFHFAIQVSIPVFIFISVTVYKVLIMDSVHAKTAPIQI